MNFHEHVLFQAKTWPEKPALILSDRIVTYGMMGQGIRGVARSLSAAGIGRGDVVGFQIDLPSWNLILSCALAHIGAVGAAFGSQDPIDRLGVSFKAVIGQSDLSARTRHRCLIMTERWFDLAPETRPVRFEDDAVIRVVFSSGTTGTPKPLAFTALSLRERLQVVRVSIGYRAVDRLMILVGLSTCYGLVYALEALSCGASLVLPPDTGAAIRMAALYGAEGMIASPRAAELMIEDLRRGPTPMPALSMAVIGGGMHSPALAGAVMAHLCKNAVCVYGSTETGAIAWAPLDRLHVPGAVGFIGSTADTEIVDDQNRPVATGTEGHVRTRSRADARPYGDADPAAFGFDAEGWHHPGDLARIEANGLLILTGRTDQLINSGGAKTAPETIEAAFAGAPGITDIAVVAVPSGIGRPAIVALVVAAADYRQGTLADWAARNIRSAAFDRFVPVKTIPRTENGKIARGEVRQLAAAALGA
ncbi:class I adenylate-forming enzyme family protein [Prosthecodimorpha staleyi]|uniref:Long-chain fatty acid--CoA ligase n=1 Tax=Prosthecodimorpha staleyi TaxID=2840188 RepID=A0A947D1I9_9HYPH|nr:long-chain fatty acid--CoA ligase [Prosthecodimorpha staleyi]MBT9289243.1 long-chain fatty acid--CoA ligase [Prosthecodimorpha staleyi]